MSARNVRPGRPKGAAAKGTAAGRAAAKGAAARGAARAPNGAPGAPAGSVERYRRLPTGTHGLDPEEVQRDQRERLQTAMIELIARRGYRAVRILDVTKLARVSRPTFYSLYADKEALFVGVYDEISGRAARTVMKAYAAEGSQDKGEEVAIRAFCALAAAEPEAMSLFVLGAFGAGAKALERRKHTLEALERVVRSSRDPTFSEDTTDLTVKVILGGVREVTAARLRAGRSAELPDIADELAAWASRYPLKLPPGLEVRARARPSRAAAARTAVSERARRAKGPLPSGRHALSRKFILQNQRERIVDATAATVAAKGLAGLTIPEIARRANISHQTFYEIYPTKHDAFLGALKVGMHQALLVTAEAYDAHEDDWPRAVAAGLRALIDYVTSEPAHAHLSLVDTFAASPEAIEIRDMALGSFSARLAPGYELARKRDPVPAIAAEAITGGIWQILHDYIDDGRIAELTDIAPQIIYLTLVPFLGPQAATAAADQRATRR
jgi:AcrR family transcriptional regulator